jgi:Arc/MetJ-type ribon-helix-helix transcriptional regulator
MVVVGFKESISFRLTPSVLKQIDLIVATNPDKYVNRSHFARCACLKVVRQETTLNISVRRGSL